MQTASYFLSKKFLHLKSGTQTEFLRILCLRNQAQQNLVPR